MRSVAPILMLLLSLPSCEGQRKEQPATTAQALNACLEGQQLENALTPAGFTGENEAVVPMGRRVTPVGDLVKVGYFPLAVAFSPDGAYAYVVHSGQWYMEVIDVAKAEVVDVQQGAGGFRGVAATADGKYVFTGEAAHGTVSRFGWSGGNFRPDGQVEVDGVPTDLELTSDDDRLIVVSASNSAVFELDTESMEQKASYFSKGVYPYGAVLTPDDKHLLVTHVGGNSVTVIARPGGEIVADVPVGLNPMGIVVDSKRNLAYVANSDADSLSVIDLGDFSAGKTIDMSGEAPGLPGSTPNELALAPDGSRLYVSMADLNKVDVWDPGTWQRLGAIPTAHYPTGLAVAPDGKTLAVASSKGWGGAIKLKKEPSVVSFVDVPIADGTLLDWTRRAEGNYLRTRDFWDSGCPDPPPLPLDLKQERVVDHVVVIVRENKTYDAVMGDFERGNGDENLLLFGEQNTPNLHEIARQFVNMDNYYADSQESFQGHTWTTQADCNDFFEKLYPSDVAQVLLAGWDPSSIIGERTVFDHFYENGITFRNYGEFEGFSKEMFGRYKDFIDMKFPYYNMAIKDIWKAQEFIRELELGIFPEFIYMALPNDHTAGAKTGFPTVQSMVADNDEATGMVVDAISHSPYWDSTVIFIIEDDPQGCGDHVHAHRSICVVAGPWVRREYTSSVHYSIPAMYRTIQMLLRVPPMHKNDAFAPPMYDIFVQGSDEDPPDLEPYVYVPRLLKERFNEPGDRLTDEAEAFDFSELDNSPGLGCHIWRVVRGDEPVPSYAKKNDR